MIKRLWIFVLPFLFIAATCGPPTPEPTPTPGPVTCECSAPPSEDASWNSVHVDVPYGLMFVRAARDIIGPKCGSDQNAVLALVAIQVNVQNVCAIAPWGGAVLVGRPDGAFEQWNIVNPDGCWAPIETAFKGAWHSDKAKGCK